MSMKKKIFTVGSGSWGTALAAVLADNKQDVLLYGRNSQEIDDINRNHHNSRYFNDLTLPSNLTATNDLSQCCDYDIIMLAVPSTVCVQTAAAIDKLLHKPAIFINAAKGFHPETFCRLSEMITETVSKEHLSAYFALSGPSFAEEVIQKQITTVNIVGKKQNIALELQKMFSNDYFRVYRNNDLIGCEYAAGLKNVIAIASGIINGLGLHDNAKASLITRGLSEISRYGLAHGAEMSTFMGLCGMGDLILTCSSFTSRNFQAGYIIGKNNSAAAFYEQNRQTVEGVEACKIIYRKSVAEKIEMPITAAVYQVLFENKRPSDIINSLMHRDLKYEIY
ncbi:MAG: NAD(P)H-dependent glycerol-3-phosphate dehydrogenase [Erysipelotrichia bacterium]|nr:NAD(P)H-dependent glycerol-3-phosphate dehydrogenase [Erysipelotrichia bacterium]